MPSYRWTTFQDLLVLQERMNRFLEEAIRRGSFQTEEREPGQWVPACDVFETANDIRLALELPGVDREDVDLHVAGDRLVIRGSRQVPEGMPAEAFLRMERTYGPFRRDFQLPTDADPERASAEMVAGVLYLTVPKASTLARSVPIASPAAPRE